MLVLTRRNDESIVFPEIGVTVSVLRIRGNVVKVGINAPDDVTVLRKEVLDDPTQESALAGRKQQRHDVLNQLHTLKLALHLVDRQLAAGNQVEANKLLERIVKGFAALEDLVDPRGASRAKIAASQNGDESSRQALLVEDDPNQSELLAGYLKLSGFDVTVAGDGDEALQALQTGATPDVVLLDMIMPRLDGAETVARIRHMPQLERLKVFAISGTDPTELGVPDGPLGVDRWFPKPLDPAQLVRTLRNELAPAASVA